MQQTQRPGAATAVAQQEATASFETLAAGIRQAEQAEEQWKKRKDYLRGVLVQLNQAGVAPAKFTAAGKNWSLCDGKKAWEYPEQIQQWEANLQDHKAIAQITGTATYTVGDPYYTSRKIEFSTSAVKI